MSSSNRWTRTSAAEARAKASSSTRRQEFQNRRQEFQNSLYDNEERHRWPPGGHAQRKHEEVTT